MSRRLRFSVGDLARIVVAVSPDTAQSLGNVVEVVLVGPWPAGSAIQVPGDRLALIYYPTDYLINTGGPRPWMFCDDYILAPIDPPAEPESLTRDSSFEAIREGHLAECRAILRQAIVP